MSQPSNVYDATMRIAAGHYAKKGWLVFPVHNIRDGKCSCGTDCGSPGKHPRTRKGFLDASNEGPQLDEWWAQWPDANIGLALGLSGLVAVDVDPRNGGDESLVELEQRNGELPPTLMNLTGGGGLHYIYSRPDGVERVLSTVPAQGVEIKSHGAYVVLPPSSHFSGRPYTWDSGQPDAPTPAPFWLCQKLSKKEQVPTRSPADGAIGVAFIAAGMAGMRLGPDRMAVKCPWEHEHSMGQEYDTSTVVFGPSGPSGLGFFHCSHSHCVARFHGMKAAERMATIFAMLPAEAVTTARAQMPPPQKRREKLELLNPWELSIRWNHQGTAATKDAGNLALLLNNLEEWKGVFRYDESRDSVYWAKEPPHLDGLRAPEIGAIGDWDYIYIAQWFNLHPKYKVSFTKECIRDNVLACAYANRHNSLTDHLNALKWDKVGRLDRWLTMYLGAPDTAYTRFVGRAWLVSAMARAYKPGVQADYVLTLEGKQGVGKTSTFRILGSEWYTGNVPNIDDKDARLQLVTSWITEFQELASFRGVEQQKIKAFITDREDKYRPPYGANVVSRPRRCVFGATTNEGEYIADSTGARRFWPVVARFAKLAQLADDREALLAEAREAYFAGVEWHPRSEHDYSGELAEEQEARMAVDPRESLVRNYIEGRRQRGDKEVTLNEVMHVALSLPPERLNQTHSRDAGAILRKLGCTKTKKREGSTLLWVWKLPEAPEA